MAVAALVISIVALFLAGWSGWSTHRSARSAAEAVELERMRHHEERRPRLRLLYEPARPGRDEGLWLLNDGPDAFRVLRVALIAREGGGPVEAIRVATLDGGIVVVREGEEVTFGRELEIGDKYLLRLVRGPSRRRGTVRLRFICSNEQGEWPTTAECPIPGRVPRAQVRRSNGATERP